MEPWPTSQCQHGATVEEVRVGKAVKETETGTELRKITADVSRKEAQFKIDTGADVSVLPSTSTTVPKWAKLKSQQRFFSAQAELQSVHCNK